MSVFGVWDSDSELSTSESRVILETEECRDMVDDDELAKGTKGPGWDLPGKFFGFIPGDLRLKSGHRRGCNKDKKRH